MAADKNSSNLNEKFTLKGNDNTKYLHGALKMCMN